MPDQNSLTTLTAEIVRAFVANNRVRTDELPQLIQAAYKAMAGVGRRESPPSAEEFTPAVSLRKSLASRDHILSMIDGKPYTSLKRHLRTHGLTFEEYKARYQLPASYPSVAPGYSEKRSAMAQAMGLGRKPGARSRKR